MATSDNAPNAADGPDFTYEAQWCDKGYVIGVDEAGRGPWAGPVCAAAFWIRPDKRALIPSSLNDSKKISAKKRALIEADLRAQKDDAIHDFEAATASVAEIDTHGILQANLFAMGRAVEGLAQRLLNTDPLNLATTGQCQIAHIFIDGNLLPPLSYPASAIIKGDGRVLSIAAASIIAKQTRDAIMAELHKAYPFYGWDSNQGYGTSAHMQGLDSHGICEHHRTSFAPIKKRLS